MAGIMTPHERNAVGLMLDAFARFAEPRQSLQQILDATIDLTESNTSHIADMEASIVAGRLVDVSGGLDGDLEKFRREHDPFFFINPVVPILDKAPATVIANSELTGHAEWRNSVYLNEFLLSCRIEDGTLVLPRRHNGTLTRFAMGIGHRRKRPVTRRVRKILEWLAPVIRQGFLNIENWYDLAGDGLLLQRGFENSPVPLALVGNNSVRVLSAAAEELLGVQSVSPAKSTLLKEIADVAVRSRLGGNFAADVRAADGRTVRAELLDLAHPIYGRAILIRFHPGSASSASRPCLTAREAEVLSWVAGGASNNEVAERLQISVNTARAHLRNIYKRLQISSRIEAAALLRQSSQRKEIL